MTADTEARTVSDVRDAYRAALEAHDYDAVGEVFAEDALLLSYSERNRPSSAQEVRGRAAIVQGLKEAPADLVHTVSDFIVGDDGFACVLTCRYPSGGQVVC